jgi:predicted phosphodiesterase
MIEQTQDIRVAISGDPHGQHDTVFKAVRQYERNYRVKIDLLICCGDYEVSGHLISFNFLALGNAKHRRS